MTKHQKEIQKYVDKITLEFLKTGGDDGIRDIRKSKTLVLGSDKLLYISEWKKRGFSGISNLLQQVNCIWAEDHDKAVTQKCRRKIKGIFISRICDIAVAEYQKVCEILGVNRILLVSFEDDKEFFKKSRKTLKSFDIEIEDIKW